MNFRPSIVSLIYLVFLCLNLSAQNYRVEKLPSTINSAGFDEISPIITNHDDGLFFTRVGYPVFEKTVVHNGREMSSSLSARKYDALLGEIYSEIAGRKVIDATSSSYNQDIWMASFDGHRVGTVSHPRYPLNNALPNSISSATDNANAFISINQFKVAGGMKGGFSIVQKQNGRWSHPSPMHIDNYYTNDDDVSLSMSPNGEVLILSLKRMDSKGQTDLYYSTRKGPNEWSEPINMGKGINSHGREITPHLSADNKMIFFASNRAHKNHQTDIYISRRLDNSWTNWSEPQKLAEPINTYASESQPFFHSKSGYLYFCSDRDGSSDIFRVNVFPPSNEQEVVINGQIINSKTGEPIGAQYHISNKRGGEKRKHFSKDGVFKLTIHKDEILDLSANLPDFICHQKTMYGDMLTSAGQKEVKIQLLVDPIEEDVKINLDKIYFEQSQAEVKRSSMPELKRLYYILRKHNHISLVIEGHTDNQGKPFELQALSQARAETIKKYLVRQGISKSRIETIGYGPDRPINNNVNPKLREKNRRVELIISEVNETLVSRR